MDTFLIKALQLIASLSLLVIVHEFGHFMFARIFKVRVEKFYLFFNPWFSLFKFKPKNSDTEYGIGWLPLGGYVKIAGMIDESMDKEQMQKPAQPWEFRAKPAWQRLLIMVGGVMMNLVLAFVIYSMMIFTWGDNYIPLKNATLGMDFNETAKSVGFKQGDILLSADGVALERLNEQAFRSIVEAQEVTVLRNGQEVKIAIPEEFMQMILKDKEATKQPFATMRYPMVVHEAVKGGIADKAGLQAKDSIVGLNGRMDMSVTDITAGFAENKGKPVVLNYYRNGVLTSSEVVVDSLGKIEVMLEGPLKFYTAVTEKYSFFESFPKGAQKAFNKLTGYVSDMKYVFTKEGAKSVGGFGAIGGLFPSQWSWPDFWELTAFLSVALAFMNIIPIPALDGGHVMFLFYEMITGKQPNEKFMEYAQMAGMIFLFSLMLYANGMDLFRAFFK
ncbi:MAG: RIP metalloprotease RseP [Bacteroidales bacterium]